LAEIGVQLQQCVAGADLHADAIATDVADAAAAAGAELPDAAAAAGAELPDAAAAAGAELPDAAAAAVAVAVAAVGVPRSQAGPANLHSSIAVVVVGSAAAAD